MRKMLAAINFNNQSGLHTNEVTDIRRNGVLPPKRETAELTVSQKMPQASLGVGLIAS